MDPETLDFAVEIVRSAGELTLPWFFSDKMTIARKQDGTPVTPADRAAERYLRAELKARFPRDAVIGEEEPDIAGGTDRVWIIDPIDGTKAFIRGVPLFSTLLAMYDSRGPAIGIIHMPALDQTVWAGRGRGCMLDGEPAGVNTNGMLSSSCVSTSDIDGWDASTLCRLGSASAMVRTWGDGYGYSLVATGRIEAMVDPQVALWDIAAMPVIMEEAGGTYTSMNGEPYPQLDPDVEFSAVASNGRIHAELLEVLGGV